MNPVEVRTDENRAARHQGRPPFLSHSQVAKYLTCPESYRLCYVERLRKKVPDAALVFGQAVHAALAGMFSQQHDPVARFAEAWATLEKVVLEYGAREKLVLSRRCASLLVRM